MHHVPRPLGTLSAFLRRIPGSLPAALGRGCRWPWRADATGLGSGHCFDLFPMSLALLQSFPSKKHEVSFHASLALITRKHTFLTMDAISRMGAAA
jgi:hypothetical protein